MQRMLLVDSCPCTQAVSAAVLAGEQPPKAFYVIFQLQMACIAAGRGALVVGEAFALL